MTDEPRSIELEIEVAGSPEEVWRAIATGPGISSWYVPHEVDEHVGGRMVARFGPGEGMAIEGRVSEWDPPRRVTFAGPDEGVEALAFEWFVEARDGGSCVVRLVNSGFGHGEEWDAQYDGMSEGWPMFLRNLELHLRHFRGQHGRAMLPGAMWPGPRIAAWSRLATALGTSATPAVGDRFEVNGDGAPPLAGVVAHAAPDRVALVLEQPAAGTAFLAVEGDGEQVAVSVWSYLYGPDADAIVGRDESRWQTWLAGRSGGSGGGDGFE